MLVSQPLVRASILVIFGILLCALCAQRASAEPAPPLPDARIFFDARRLFERPMVHVNVFGHLRPMLLDTGSQFHVMGLKGVEPPANLMARSGVVGLDYTGRPFSGFVIQNPNVGLPGWPTVDALWYSGWADRQYGGSPALAGMPRFDGVLSPLLLAGTNRVVILDFTTGTLSSAASWDQASTRLLTADLALTPKALRVAGDGHLVAPVVIGGSTLMMMLDTGAPTSALYVARGADLADDQTRLGLRTLKVRAGELTVPVNFTLIEPLASIDVDLGTESTHVEESAGLIGMDVLRSCIVALDRQFFVVRCMSNEATRTAAGPPAPGPPLATRADLIAIRKSKRRHKEVVRVGDAGLDLQPRADGSYEWSGVHSAVRIRKDGRMTFSGLPGAPIVFHAEMDADEERRWFEDHVSGLLVALARAHEHGIMQEALEELPGRLSAILADQRLSLAERRRILFLLWDEMAEPDDTERGWAGARARRLIDMFVQDCLPAGTPGAFSAAELAAFNRTRRDKIQFEPYTAPAGGSQRDTDDDR